MDAKLKKIQIDPVKLNADGEIQKSEMATITLEVPLDTISQKDEIVDLLDVLSKEWVKVSITSQQISLSKLSEAMEESSFAKK